ncbi:MAG: tetratricopeptide repeat protein, partial [Nitrospirota bacterium]|nr:tetratricopeptide repeat protein [Nitrospirota bacterium]
RYEEALQQYRKVLEIDPSQPFALWDIAVVYEKMGMKEKADEQYRYYHEMTDCSFRKFWNCLD